MPGIPPTGGTLIGTSALPRRAAEFDSDEELRDLVEALFHNAAFIADPTTSVLGVRPSA